MYKRHEGHSQKSKHIVHLSGALEGEKTKGHKQQLEETMTKNFQK